jgi:hypothetical protein
MASDFHLRFAPSQIEHWASRYSYKDDDAVENGVGPRVRIQGYYTRDDFLTLCRWKAPRAERHFVQNKDDDIRSVTALALSTQDERLKMCLPMALHGLGWPMASVMLHFAAKDHYPMRALPVPVDIIRSKACGLHPVAPRSADTT